MSKISFVTRLLHEFSISKLKMHLISGNVTKVHTKDKPNPTNKVMRIFVEHDVENVLEKQSNIESSFARNAKWSEWKGEQKVHSRKKENIDDSYEPLLEYEYNYVEEKHETLSHLLTPSTYSNGPLINQYHSSNVTALSGVSATLNCRVHQLGNKTVSWIRGDNLHLLTVGRYTYTSDLRFEAHHVPHSLDWSLIIRNPQTEDSGLYQCQVSSTPHLAKDIWLIVKGIDLNL